MDEDLGSRWRSGAQRLPGSPRGDHRRPATAGWAGCDRPLHACRRLAAPPSRRSKNASSPPGHRRSARSNGWAMSGRCSSTIPTVWSSKSAVAQMAKQRDGRALGTSQPMCGSQEPGGIGYVGRRDGGCGTRTGAKHALAGQIHRPVRCPRDEYCRLVSVRSDGRFGARVGVAASADSGSDRSGSPTACSTSARRSPPYTRPQRKGCSPGPFGLARLRPESETCTTTPVGLDSEARFSSDAESRGDVRV